MVNNDMGPLNSVWLGTLDIACLPGAYVYFAELFLVNMVLLPKGSQQTPLISSDDSSTPH